MPGVILEVQAAPGVTVRRGDALAVLEAMKMRNTIRAPRDGEVAAVLIEPGQAVRAGEAAARPVRLDPGMSQDTLDQLLAGITGITWRSRA